MGRTAVQIALIGLMVTLPATLQKKNDSDIYSFHINATVTSRYATTVITSHVANHMDESKQIDFHVRIPKNAFISKFRMFIDGQVYDAKVMDKEQAQMQYTMVVCRGESTGFVSSAGRTLEDFNTSVTIPAHKNVTFELTYEELMKRKLGQYELQIHAQPMQPVKDFKVDVHIKEKANIRFLDVKGGLSTKALANAITKTHACKQAWVHFYPTEDQQKVCDSCSEQGLNGDLVIVYDVNSSTLGDIMVCNRYFVHHFAPCNLFHMAKNIVFVVDRSGSLNGRKIQQTRTALIHILGDLAEDDHFGLITFDEAIYHWKSGLVQATSANLESAKSFAREITDRGKSDINRAVLEGTRMLKAHPREGSASILILLTDGDPTSGETNTEIINSNVRQAIAGKFPLYCLGFGFDVMFEFLEKMALQNNGMARWIYDADDQLMGFYKEVATPLLTGVTMSYKGGSNLTQTNFSHYYNGSEIVVAGQIDDNSLDPFTPEVVAISRTERMTFSETCNPEETTDIVCENHIQRAWAYLTVQQLLQKELQMSGPEKEEVKKQTLELSLKYSFVTPHTSIVITKPPGEMTTVLNKPGESKQVSQETLRHILNSAPLPVQSSRPFHPQDSYPGFQRTFCKVLSRHDFQDTRHRPVTSRGSSFALGQPGQDARTPRLNRFLIKTNNLALPLCFDISGYPFIKLLHHPSRELFVNGELDSVTSAVFKKIVIHFEADKHVEVDTEGVTVRVGENTTRLTGQDLLIADSLTVVTRSKEVDIAAGDTIMVIIVHEKAGKEFFWPVMRQKPSVTNIEGILALKPASYEDGDDFPTVKKINGQKITVRSTSAFDYSITPPERVTCWLMDADCTPQRPLNDFLVAQL